MSSRRRSRSVFEETNDPKSPEVDVSKRQRRVESRDNEGEVEQGGEGQEEQENSDDDDDGNLHNDVHYAPNEYSPGAVVRVKLVNFVTYEKAEFRPGPNLNMIIGPNGTGKSSLVCALALGLGYPTNVLGRATKYSEYVTHGRDSATIEIELQKRPQDQSNHVVRLQITRESNNRRFWLNKREVTVKKIQSIVSKLRIACDNLCQFLPQEKVAEFAGLTPVQLLHETLRAAAPEEMINWQVDLKGLFKDYKGVKSRRDTDKVQLLDYENRQQGLQADVDRLKEREAIKQNVQDIKKARACAEYSIARLRHRAANKKKKDARKRLKDLEQACGPALQAVNDKEAYRDQIEAVLDLRKRALKNAEGAADQASRAVEQVEEQIKDTANLIDNEKKQFQSKKAETGKARQMITKFEADYRNQPPQFDPADWNQKIVSSARLEFRKVLADHIHVSENKSISCAVQQRRSASLTKTPLMYGSAAGLSARK